MPAYYNVARIKRGQGFKQDANGITIDLATITDQDHIKDDHALIGARHPDSFFYLSGGGSFLLENRYLLVVRRADNVAINPGKLSLFTGRADGPDEWRNPTSVVRELFEELTLFENGELLYPTFPAFQPIIDRVYKNAGRPKGKPLPLEHVDLPTTTLTLMEGSKKLSSTPVFCHINSHNDINLFFLFKIAQSLDQITAVDDELGAGKRMIAAFDLQTRQLIELSTRSDARARFTSSNHPMTENLTTMLKVLDAKKS